MITDKAVPNIFMPHNRWILPKPARLTPLEKILKDVANKLSMSEDIIKSRIRERAYVDARRMYFKRAKEKTNATLAEIGALVHNGNHANVAYHIKEVDKVPSLKRKYNEMFNGLSPIINLCDPVIKKVNESESTIVHLSLTGKPIYETK